MASPPPRSCSGLLGASSHSFVVHRRCAQLLADSMLRNMRQATGRSACCLPCRSPQRRCLLERLGGVYTYSEQQAELLDTLQRSVQPITTCAASCPPPGKAFRAEDADALARVISCRRSVFPKHFSGAPIDRRVALDCAQPEPLSATLGVCPAPGLLKQRTVCSRLLNKRVCVGYQVHCRGHAGGCELGAHAWPHRALALCRAGPAGAGGHDRLDPQGVQAYARTHT